MNDLVIMNEVSNLREWIEKRADQYGDKICVFFKDQKDGREKKITHSQFNKRINQMANILDLGVKVNHNRFSTVLHLRGTGR